MPSHTDQIANNDPSVEAIQSSEELVDDTEIKGTGSKQPKKTSSGPNYLEVILHILLPDVKVRTAHRKTKNEKQDPITKGPKDFPLDIGWPGFLAALAELAGVCTEVVLTETIRWRWLKPKNSQYLPLCDAGGLKSLMRQVHSRNKDWVIIVEMKRPKTMAIPTNEDDDFDDEPSQKKSKSADDQIESIVEELRQLYPPGRCKTHPEIACFHNEKTDLHFKLDRKELLVWAASIASGNASLAKLPIGSPFFQANKALKKICSPTSPSHSNDSHFLHPPASQYLANPQFFDTEPSHIPFAWQPFRPGTLPPPESALFAFSTTSNANNCIIDLDAPSLPLCSITDFCNLYKLNKNIEAGLEKIGFYIGCDMKFFTNIQLTTAGLRPGDWEQVYRAYEKYKRTNKALVQPHVT